MVARSTTSPEPLLIDASDAARPFLRFGKHPVPPNAERQPARYPDWPLGPLRPGRS